MKPIKLAISKKTKVPTKRQIVNQFRSDWKKVGMIDYLESQRLFYKIGGGPIKTDAQFATYFLQNFGEGKYMIIAWRKGRRSFWGFLNIEVSKNGFSRLRRGKSREDEEKDGNKKDIQSKKEQLEKVDDPTEKEEIQEEISDLEEDIGDIEEGKKEKRNKNGPYPYLDQTKPIFSFHALEPLEYEEHSSSKNKESTLAKETKDASFW